MTEDTALQQFDIASDELFSPEKVQKQLDFIREIMKKNMIKGHHYGVIPGTKKPTLFKPGAELLCLAFRLSPRYEVTKTDLRDDHREYQVICELSSIHSQKLQGEGVGMATTRESKHRYRWANRVCPSCSADKIFASKAEYGGGFYCNKHKGGCGAKFSEDDPQITSQEQGRRENPDVADQYNTVLKMAKKRAHTDAVFTVTACSDIFQREDDDPDDPQNDDDDDKTSGNKYRTEEEAKAAKEKAAQDKKNKSFLAKADAEALVVYAKSYDWTEEEFQKLLSEFECKRVNDVVYGMLDDIKARIDGGGPPEEEEGETK